MRRSLRLPRPLLAALALVGAVVVSLAWAVPNIAGAAFVSVRAVVVPIDGAAASSPGPRIRLADGSVRAGGVRIDLELTNRYPMPVVVAFRGPAFDAWLQAPGGGAAGAAAWQSAVDDPRLEQDVDSPGGSSSTRVVVIQPGSHVVSMTPDGATLDPSASPALTAPATYRLGVSAYGIAAPEQAITILPPGS